jgi:hypothetical protein
MIKRDARTSPSSGTNLSGEFTFSIPIRPLDVTSGTAAPPEYLLDTRLTEQAREMLGKIPDKTVAETARELMGDIERAAYALKAAGRDIGPLLPIHGFIADDGSVTLEWTTADFRLGFNIERDPSESGVYLATSKLFGEFGFHQLLSGVNKTDLVDSLVKFVLANS